MAGHIASSSAIDWCTPLWITDNAPEVFGKPIGLDPCANPGSIDRVKAQVNYTLPGNDGLVDTWQPLAPCPDGCTANVAVDNSFVNSPFGTCYMNKVTREIVMPKELTEHLKKFETKALRAAARRAFMLEHTKYCIADWVKRCAKEHDENNMQVMQLGPANVDTKAWQRFIIGKVKGERVMGKNGPLGASAILYMEGRLRFELVDFVTKKVVGTGPAPMACALSYWGLNITAFERVYAKYGDVRILR